MIIAVGVEDWLFGAGLLGTLAGKNKAPRCCGALDVGNDGIGNSLGSGLTLGELEALTSTWATWLLTFLGAAVAGEEAVLFQGSTELWVHTDESAGDAEADCADLAGDATTIGRDAEVIGHAGVGEGEGEDHLVLVSDDGEVFFEITSVDGDGTGSLADEDAGDGGFAAACGVGDGLAHEKTCWEALGMDG